MRLRQDSWSGGAARVMTRCGLRESSFEQAAEGYREATGGSVSGASIRRVTQGFGQQVRQRQTLEAARAADVGPYETSPRERWLPLEQPLVGVGNVSSDGTMILIRKLGWKEVKVAAFSEVTALPQHHPERRSLQRAGELAQRELVRLSQHSYCAGLWDADTFGSYQYLEGLRRGFDRLVAPSSVNDGSKWITRVTSTNFPRAQIILDWMHGSEHLWAVGNAVFGETTPAAAQWVKLRQAELWEGHGEVMLGALETLELQQARYPELVQQAPGYFAERLAETRYADFRKAGYPIGSGTVESAARNVVQPRMRRPGRGWDNTHADAMLAALAEFHSGRLANTWERLSTAA